MPRRSHLRTAWLAAIAALSSPLLLACGSGAPSTPNVAPFKQTAGTAGACGAIMSALPKTLNRQSRVKSTGSPFGAVWGSPAIVLRCGVPEPTAFAHDDPNNAAACLTVNGIDWYLEGTIPNDASSDRSITVTTVYRSPAIEVTVPAHYGTQGPSTAMALLTSVVRSHTTVRHHCV